MAVNVKLEGNGAWEGGGAALSTYSVDEESTPLVAGDSSGAVSALTFSVVSVEDTPLLYETPLVLEDGSNGVVRATITGLTMNDHTADIQAESLLSPLVPERQMPPRVGTLQQVIGSLMTESGITATILYDTSLQATMATSVAMQGWYGSAWDWLKQLCQTYQFEVSVVDNNILVRAPRTRTTNQETDTQRTVSITRGEVAKHIEIVKYENQYKANQIVYPAGGWTNELEIYSVEANETVEVEIPVDVSIMSIEQPVCVQFVSKVHTGGSVYAVAGNDGLPIPPALWAGFGGKVSVAIGEDTKTILLTITGPDMEEYSPYTLSVTSGASNAYSSLRLRGTGVHYTRDVLKYPTGADPRWASEDVGITIDNPTIQNMDQVATLALSATRRYSAPLRTYSASALVVNRPGEAGFVKYLTFDDFDKARADTYLFSSFKTEFSGKTFGQIRDTLRTASSATTRYENQAFGNVVGSMVRHGDSKYRIRRATISESTVNYEAEADNTFADMKTALAGKTFAQIKTLRTGLTFSEVSLTPLRNS